MPDAGRERQGIQKTTGDNGELLESEKSEMERPIKEAVPYGGGKKLITGKDQLYRAGV